MNDTLVADPIEHFLDLVEHTTYNSLSPEAVASAKVFLMDTAGVALAGRLAPKMDAMVALAMAWDGTPTSGVPIWNMSRRASAPVASLVNGYQCHALEYDCVYEPGVILPTPPIMGALYTKLVQMTDAGRAPSGQDLIRAFVVALEMSCTLALAAKSSMYFFRPATTGVFSALAALNCLDPLPRDQLRHAFGIGYSQMCGTMQAHEEGSMMLAMQMGFAARNAVQAHAMAALGITGPVQVLGGRFGFYEVFEHEGALDAVLPELAAPWKVTQLSHKPFPSGRVTHGVIHALRMLRQQRQLDPATVSDAIVSMRVELPPLGFRLTGRPTITNPPPNYARLCIPFVGAAELLTGNVDPTTFSSEILARSDIEALARRIETVEVAHPDPNAFYPQKLQVRFSDGSEWEQDIPHAWGHPLMPLDKAARENKFALCCRLAQASLPEDDGRTVADFIGWIEALEHADDCQPLLRLLCLS